MTDITRILCPIDFSNHSRRALEQALMMARWYGATVRVLHVAAPAVAPIYPPVPIGMEPVATSLVDRQALTDEVTRFITQASTADVPTEVLVRQGLPAAEILAEAANGGVDLIVLGTHGRSGFERFVLGSVTERVLHKSDCAVLTVPVALDSVAVPETPLVKRILCAIDFSESSMNGLAQALLLAQEADARLTILHVVSHELDDLSGLSEAAESTGHLTIREFRRQREDAIRAALAAAVPERAKTFCDVEIEMAHGRPWREILRVAGERSTDLIVLGVRGRSTADLAMFGSTTHHVIRQACCPVLTLKSRAGSELPLMIEALEE